MPNWCSNKAVFIAKTEQAIQLYKDFKKYLEDGNTHFFSFFMPTGSWGTKWDVNLNLINLYHDLVIDMYEDTAWTPPIEFYDFMVEKGFDVQASYYEPGCGFVGKYNNGADDYRELLNGDESFQILRSTHYACKDLHLKEKLNFDILQAGNVLENEEDDDIIIVDHYFVPWVEFESNNEEIFDSGWAEWEDSVAYSIGIKEDFYIVDVILDNSKCGSVKGFVVKSDPWVIHLADENGY